MGHKGSRLGDGELSICRSVANGSPKGLVDESAVKHLMARYKQAKANGATDEFKSPAELQQALESLGFFKKQGEQFQQSIKLATQGTDPIAVKNAMDLIFVITQNPEWKEDQSAILFSAFDKDGDGTVDLREVSKIDQLIFYMFN
jgi:Ca2+-binding EF-hand superfamily protein